MYSLRDPFLDNLGGTAERSLSSHKQGTEGFFILRSKFIRWGT